MSLQDNYFDVRAALEGQPELEDFEQIWERFCEYEKANERMGRALQTFRDAMTVLKTLDADSQ